MKVHATIHDLMNTSLTNEANRKAAYNSDTQCAASAELDEIDSWYCTVIFL